MTETPDWPDATIPEWLHEIAEDPSDYEGGLKIIQGTVTPVGWVSWQAGNEIICLDGDFTAKQLREIADMMEAHAA